MGRTFTAMKTKVGNFVEDTDAQLLTLVGEWLNDKYADAWSRTIWSNSVNKTYSFATVASQTNYDLPLDFDQELFLANITDGKELNRYNEQQWLATRFGAYSSGTIDASDSPDSYLILKGSAKSSKTGFGVLELDPQPSKVLTMAMPYKRKFNKLLGTTGTCTTDTASKIIAAASTFITSEVKPGMVVKNTTDNTYGYIASVDSETQLTMDTDLCPDGNETFEIQNEVFIDRLDWILELGAIAELYAYKKNFGKGDYYAQKYETELAKRIMQEYEQVNQLYQNRISGFNIEYRTSLTGNASYDSV